MNGVYSFNQRCYQLLKCVPEGRVTTYKEMARAMGTSAWRAVGTAMAQNQELVVIPCHRVVRSDGSIGQYALGSDTKAQLLRSEGVPVSDGKIKDLSRFLYKFSD